MENIKNGLLCYINGKLELYVFIIDTGIAQTVPPYTKSYKNDKMQK